MTGVPGVDGILYGPNDMSGTTSRFLDTGSPEVVGAIEQINAAAKRAAIPFGAGFGGTIEERIAKGEELILESTTMLLLTTGTDAIVTRFRACADSNR